MLCLAGTRVLARHVRFDALNQQSLSEAVIACGALGALHAALQVSGISSG